MKGTRDINSSSVCVLFIYMPSEECDDHSQNKQEYASISNMHAYITYANTLMNTHVCM
jgi:hypothetical protein